MCHIQAVHPLTLNSTNQLMQVKTEHDILAQLAQQTLSFKVPTAVPALSGQPYVVLSSGAAACVFEIIPGEQQSMVAA